MPSADRKRTLGAWASDNPHLVALALVLAGAAALRFWGLGRQSLWWDEGYSVTWSQLGYSGILDLMVNRDFHPPEYYFALHAWMGIFGVSAEGARALSALFGLLGVVAIYWLGRDMFSRRVGVVAALLVAVSLFHIYYSQEVRGYSLLFATAVLSMHAYWRMQQGLGPPAGSLAYYLVATTALLYSHNAGLYVVVAQALHYAFGLAMRYDRASLLRGGFAFGGVALLYLPWLFVLTRQAGRLQDGFWMKGPFQAGQADFTVFGTLALFVGSAVGGWLLWLLVLNGVVKGTLGGLNREANPDDREAYEPYPAAKVLLLVGWFLASVFLPYLQSVVSQPIYVSRIIIPALAPFLLLAAVGLGRMRNPAVLGMGLALAVGVALVPAVVDYHTTEFKEPWDELAAHVDANATQGALVLFWPPNSQGLFEVYSERTDLVPMAMHAVPTAAEAANLTAGAPQVWIVGRQGDPVTMAGPVSEARGDRDPEACQRFAPEEALAGYPLASNFLVACRFR